MKSLILIFLILLTGSLSGSDYKYNHGSISESRFNQMFKEFSKLLYTDGTKVYDLRIGNKDKFTANANLPRKFSSRHDGKVDGIIYKILDAKSFLLKVGKSVIYVTGNVDTTKLTEITKHSSYLGHTGKHTYKKNDKEYELKKCSVLIPITKEIFKNYIQKKKLYRYKKIVERVPARKTLCMKCKGDGRYGHKRLPCGACKRSGTVVVRWKQRTSWERQDVK